MSTLLSSPLSLRGTPATGTPNPTPLRHVDIPTVEDDSKVVDEKVLAEAKWLSLSELTYVDGSGMERKWEAVMRVRRAQGSDVDSVTVLASYRRLLHYDCLLLVKQYRPALRAHTIELPSGLVLAGESPEQSAEREVRECAGFEGVARKAGPELAADPTASGCAMRIVTVEINGDDPTNNFINTRAAGDRLKVPVLVPISELPERLQGFASAGFIVDSRLDSFAIGLSMGGLGARRAKGAAPPV